VVTGHPCRAGACAMPAKNKNQGQNLAETVKPSYVSFLIRSRGKSLPKCQC